MRLTSIRVGTVVFALFTLLMSVPKGHAAFYPVYPWTSLPTFSQDFACIGKPANFVNGRDGVRMDSCYSSVSIHDGLDMVPETSVKNTDGYTGSIWDIRSTV